MGVVVMADVYGPVGLGIGIVGIFVAIMGVLYATRRARLVYYQEGEVVVMARPAEALEVMWKGQQVPAFSRTRIWVWNAGSSTLDRSATVPGYPLCLRWEESPTVEILSTRMIMRSREENAFEAQERGARTDSVEISFEYLDPRYGAVFEVEHTGTTWKAVASGTLKGAKATLREELPRSYYSRPRWWAISLLFLLPAVLAVAALAARHPGSTWIASGASLGVILLVLSIFLVRDWRHAPPGPLQAARDSKLVNLRWDARGQPLPK